MSFTLGENVGPYRIIEQLGQGGMATVYKAYHAALDRYVAIKVLHPAFTQDPNFLSRFQREARVVAKLEHPNIVPVYDFAEHQGQPYLVMKFIQGETLKARLNRGPLSQEEVLRVVEAVGSALAYAHQQGILHRDIKPSNIILAEDGHIYLADFGLARIAQAGESTLSSDMLLGTPQYISPEQALGRPDLDEGTDIYSFGVVLYELVVGRVPYSADTPYSIIHDHIYTPLPLPRKINPAVPEAVERVLLKALAKERADRYPDVQSLVEAFKAAYSAQPAPPPLAESRPSDTVSVERAADEALTQVESPAATQKAEVPATDAATRPRKRLRWRWWYLLPIGALCLCTLVFVGAASRQNPKRQPATRPAAQATTGQPATPRRRTGIPPTRSSLEEALNYVQAHPEDPRGYLDAGRQLLDAGRDAEALRYLDEGAIHAAQDADYYIAAGSLLKAHELWANAAAMYLQATHWTEGEWPPQLYNGLHESAYKAATEPLTDVGISFDQLAEVDLALAGVVKARYLLHQGNLDEAQRLLDAVTGRKPDMPEATLLQAELEVARSQPDKAVQLLKELAEGRPNIPAWIKDEANRQLQTLIP